MPMVNYRLERGFSKLLNTQHSQRSQIATYQKVLDKSKVNTHALNFVANPRMSFKIILMILNIFKGHPVTEKQLQGAGSVMEPTQLIDCTIHHQ